MKPKNWWEDVFGKIYLNGFIPLCSEEKTKKEAIYVIKQLGLKKGDSILDIPCGNGRHSLKFAEKGLKVTGLDYSIDLLQEARKNAKTLKLNINFVKQDIRKLNINKKFDGIAMLGNSFGYFNDTNNEKVIKNISAHLKNGAMFFLDLPNTPGMLRNIQTKSKHKIPGGYMTAENKTFNPITCVLELEWQVNLNKKNKKFTGKIRLYLLPEIAKLLAEYNLTIKKVTGSYTGTKYTIDSPRMLIVAIKN